MRIDYFLIGIVIFGVSILTSVQFINDLRVNYNVTEDVSGTYMKNTYDTLDAMQTLSGQQKNATFFTPLSDTDASTSMMAGAYGAVKMIVYAFPLVQGIATDVCGQVPGMGSNCAMWIGAAMVVLTISIVFSVVVMILRAFVIQ